MTILLLFVAAAFLIWAAFVAKQPREKALAVLGGALALAVILARSGV